MKWVLFFVLLAPAALACVVPENGISIDSSTTFCSDVYYFDDGITINGSNLMLNCSGAVLKSWSGGRGISIEHVSNVTVTDCRTVSYGIGLYVRNSTGVYLYNNHLVRNLVGTRLVVVSSSATFNHDVSLIAAFEVFESENNALSLTNKIVSGPFCETNFCNEQRDALPLFAQPELSAAPADSWSISKLVNKKAAERLRQWVFGGLV